MTLEQRMPSTSKKPRRELPLVAATPRRTRTPPLHTGERGFGSLYSNIVLPGVNGLVPAELVPATAAASPTAGTRRLMQLLRSHHADLIGEAEAARELARGQAAQCQAANTAHDAESKDDDNGRISKDIMPHPQRIGIADSKQSRAEAVQPRDQVDSTEHRCNEFPAHQAKHDEGEGVATVVPRNPHRETVVTDERCAKQTEPAEKVADAKMPEDVDQGLEHMKGIVHKAPATDREDGNADRSVHQATAEMAAVEICVEEVAAGAESASAQLVANGPAKGEAVKNVGAQQTKRSAAEFGGVEGATEKTDAEAMMDNKSSKSILEVAAQMDAAAQIAAEKSAAAAAEKILGEASAEALLEKEASEDTSKAAAEVLVAVLRELPEEAAAAKALEAAERAAKLEPRANSALDAVECQVVESAVDEIFDAGQVAQQEEQPKKRGRKTDISPVQEVKKRDGSRARCLKPEREATMNPESTQPREDPPKRRRTSESTDEVVRNESVASGFTGNCSMSHPQETKAEVEGRIRKAPKAVQLYSTRVAEVADAVARGVARWSSLLARVRAREAAAGGAI